MARCWECEDEVDSTVDVKLPVSGLDRSVFRLCFRCVRDVLTPLVEGHAEASSPAQRLAPVAG